MSDFFRLKIGAKRQVTLPQLLLERLLLREGDELEFEVTGGKIEAVRALKLVPLDYFDEKTLSDLKARAAQFEQAANQTEESSQKRQQAVVAKKEMLSTAIDATRQAYHEAAGEIKKTS